MTTMTELPLDPLPWIDSRDYAITQIFMPESGLTPFYVGSQNYLLYGNPDIMSQRTPLLTPETLEDILITGMGPHFANIPITNLSSFLLVWLYLNSIPKNSSPLIPVTVLIDMWPWLNYFGVEDEPYISQWFNLWIPRAQTQWNQSILSEPTRRTILEILTTLNRFCPPGVRSALPVSPTTMWGRLCTKYYIPLYNFTATSGQNEKKETYILTPIPPVLEDYTSASVAERDLTQLPMHSWPYLLVWSNNRQTYLVLEWSTGEKKYLATLEIPVGDIDFIRTYALSVNIKNIGHSLFSNKAFRQEPYHGGYAQLAEIRRYKI